MSISATTNNNDGLGAHMEVAGCGEECIIYALDDYFQEQKVDFLKADIESYELDMLKGAKNIIKRDIPMLAVCIYHNASDLYSIITYLDALDLGYKFSVRHYSYGYADTVLYAYH